MTTVSSPILIGPFFTNVYVKKYAKRRIEDCSGCAVIEQKLDKEIQHDQL